MQHNYSGLSLLELREKYGVGANGFYNNNWWLHESFAKEKPPKGKYEIDISNDLVNLTFDEQVKKLKNGFKVPHPAIIAEALIKYYEDTGEYLVADYWLRTSSVDSDGNRVAVGFCGSGGVSVSYSWDGDRYGYVGLAAARKSTKKLDLGNLESFESSDLEQRVAELESKMSKIQKFLIIE